MKKYVTLYIIVILMLSGCGAEKIEKNPPPLVKTILASKSVKKDENIFSGVVKGRYETNLAFQTSGRILKRNVEKGNFVYAGDILMTIDDKDAVQALRNGEAQVEQAKLQMNLAKTNFERYSELYKENAIAAATLDQYRTNYENSVAAYKSALAQSEQIKNNLSYTNLTANANGIISEINAEVGQVVSAGQKILTLIQTNELEIEIDVPENYYSEIFIGKTAEVTFWAIDEKVEGRVREISPMADATARTYHVKISLLNPPSNIQLGMTAEVRLSSTKNETNAYILPISAIYEKNSVWVVKNGKVELKNVKVKNFEGNEVLVEGISGNDKIVTAGVHKLREGQEVRTE